MVCVVRQAHPASARTLRVQHYAALRHVEIALFGEVSDQIDRALARRGLSREVAVSVPHFLLIPLLVARTDLVATLPRRLVAAFGQAAGLRVWSAPVELPRLTIQQVWHMRSNTDPGGQLLRRLVREVAAQLDEGEQGSRVRRTRRKRARARPIPNGPSRTRAHTVSRT
jgi:DNA-binding transcriptional LysR family regulator